MYNVIETDAVRKWHWETDYALLQIRRRRRRSGNEISGCDGDGVTSSPEARKKGQRKEAIKKKKPPYLFHIFSQKYTS